ncbi:hypothetical protein [Brevibacillus reuszeri]|uniref:hypothetical protein n=1 Tax=Brevibacillus reuszeri TaxID=54915 RepID=UPI003D24BEBB
MSKDKVTLWERMTNIFSKRIGMSLSAAALLLMVGMITSAIVNAVTESSLLLKTYIALGMGGVAIALLGFFLFWPFWKFRWKYEFLADEGEILARKLVAINNRAKTYIETVDGLMAFQLFQVHKQTKDHHIQYHFRKVIEQKGERSDISKLRYRKMKVPIDLLSYIKHKSLRKAPADYGAYLNALLYQYIISRSGQDKRMLSALQNWDVYIEQDVRIIGLPHFPNGKAHFFR